MSASASVDAAATALGCTARMVVLVTGGTGLVGRALAAHVRNDAEAQAAGDVWTFCSSADGDLRDRKAVFELFERVRPTHVVHLAAAVGGLFKNMRAKVEMWRDNVAMNDNVFEACRIYNVSKLVSCLSTCIFPDAPPAHPIDETMIHSGPPHPSNEGYAYAKRMIDMLNRAYAEEYGCNFTSVVPTNIYGIHDHYSIEDGHVIPGLIHKAYLAKRDGTDLVVWGSGAPLRQFIAASDVAALTAWVLRHHATSDPVILAPDEADELSIRDVALLVAEATGFSGKVVFDASKADGQFKKTASNAKLRRLVPGYHFKDMRVGVKEAVDWFASHYEEARK